MAEHTTGPWHVGEPKLNGHHQFNIDDANGRGVGGASARAITSTADDATYTPEKQGEAWSNARLIAAAPDLLAVARRVAEHFDGTDAPLGIAARAAVEKAEQREP